MHEMLKRWGMTIGTLHMAAAVACGLGLRPGPALAAEYEVRMPVEKTARISLMGEPESKPAPKATLSGPAAAPKASAVKAAEDKAQDERGPVVKAPKTALAKAAEAAAHNAAPAPDAAKPAPKAHKPSAPPASADKPDKPSKSAQAAKAVVAEKAPKAAPAVSSAAASPDASQTLTETPAPKAKPAKPALRVDPLASVLPQDLQQPAPVALPGEGKWTGEPELEFQAENLVLRVPTNGAVERVTWFNLTDPAGPRKLACDLRGPWKRKGGKLREFASGPVKAIAVGEHPDRLRLALEFRDGAVRPDLDPKVELGPQGVTLTIPLATPLAPRPAR